MLKRMPRPIVYSSRSRQTPAVAIAAAAATINGRPSSAVLRPRQLHSSVTASGLAATILMPPAVFAGLLTGLWLWKITAMAAFQNKVIYLPGIPPGARQDTIERWAPECGGVGWEEVKIKSLDGTTIFLCVATVGPRTSGSDATIQAPPVYILYFQGNASSIPPRLPALSSVLRRVRKWQPKVECTLVAVSYRGYWKSSGQPSEQGINLDARAALDWVMETHRSRTEGRLGSLPTLAAPAPPTLVLWGQSIGCGIGTNLAAALSPAIARPDLLILETPFLSVRAMLAAMYPEKWIPYRYIGFLLRNHLDTLGNLGAVASKWQEAGVELPSVFILQAGRDEIVPASHPRQLLSRCGELDFPATTVVVKRACHSEALVMVEGRRAVAGSILALLGRKFGHLIV